MDTPDPLMVIWGCGISSGSPKVVSNLILMVSMMLTELWLPAGIRLTGIGIIFGRIQVKWQKTSISMDFMLMGTGSGTGKDM